MELRLAALPGDGIGPEVVDEALKVLRAAAEGSGHRVSVETADIGGAGIDRQGTPLPDATVELCRRSDAVLMGSVGGPRWDHLEGDMRPELGGLLGIRRALGVYANLRPVRLFPALARLGPLGARQVDLVVVRELTSGIYFGRPRGRREGRRGRRAVDTLAYTEREIERLVRVGFELARRRRRRVASVDKANVLESSRLWREVVNEMAREYQDVQVEHLYVDNCAMQLVLNPERFDVLVTENMFGDILSDEAGVLAGSLGVLPSASLAGAPFRVGRRRRGTRGLYEPIHGSAPDIAGQGRANPLAAVLSVALMLRYSFALEREATAVENAVEGALEAGCRTADLAREGTATLTTSEMGEAIIARLCK